MIFYCDTCDDFYTEEDVDAVKKDDLTDVPCPGCSMPLSAVSNEDGPYDTLEEKYL